MNKQKIYIAGPMRGKLEYNFPAFFKAEEDLRGVGFSVINPADLDMVLDGFHPSSAEPEPMEHYMRRDIPAIAECDAIALLPGWETSEGVRRELTAAEWFGIPAWPLDTILEAEGLPDGPPVKTATGETILEEAARITSHDRQKMYDSPLPNHRRIAALWNGYLAAIGQASVTLSPQDVARMMILLKIARDVFYPKRDNLVDIAGYARCLETMQEG